MISEFLNNFMLEVQLLGQVLLAMLLGAFIGLERELSEKPAGLRTHMLVAGASALIVNLAKISLNQFQNIVNIQSLQFDPIRIFVAVVTGISFLGAGTIIRQGSGQRVEGLTTAASLLFSSVIGMGVAFSQYFLAVSLTIIAFVTLWVIGRIEIKIKKSGN